MPIGIIWGEPTLRKQETSQLAHGWYWIRVDGREEVAEYRRNGKWLLTGAFREKRNCEVEVISERLICPSLG